MSYAHAAWMAHSQRLFAAAREGRAGDFAVELVRGELEQGWTLRSLLDVNGGGADGGYWYEWKHGRITVTQIGGKSCHEVFRVRELFDEGTAVLRGVPRQLALFEEVPA